MKVLIAGESWQTHETHTKGFDSFVNNFYETGIKWLKDSLESNGIEVNYLPNHLAATEFPLEIEILKRYNVVYLSDIGSNTLLLHPDTFLKSQRKPNRLKLIKKYVEEGGGFCMIGGYLTFQGIDGKGKWRHTPVEEILPVSLYNYDDRVEVPEGFIPSVDKPDHPVLAPINGSWPWLLGYNRLKLKEKADLLLKYQLDPILAVQDYGRGRTAAFASDCAPHWGSSAFVEWEYYSTFWTELTKWLSGE